MQLFPWVVWPIVDNGCMLSFANLPNIVSSQFWLNFFKSHKECNCSDISFYVNNKFQWNNLL